ncbi:MAG: carbohydrate porin, partial [Lysobacterales bacterium]
SAKGVAFNANFMVGQNYMWFVRGGYAQGYINRLNLTTGFGYRPSERYSDLLGFGVGWVQPSNSALRDQYTAEAFYRFQFTSNFAVTPNIQYIRDPALNPSETDLWVLGMRARVTF